MEFTPTTGLEIAVIGMAGRFPGAASIEAFWECLIDGREAISFFTPEQMQQAGVAESLIARPDYVPARGILGDAARFDAAFFGYSPKEAALMDPQQRIFLETAWNALEDAGHVGRGFSGRIGVYAAVAFNSYLTMRLQLEPQLLHGEDGALAMLANDKDFLATRVSYKLNLTGPSLVVQSACSSSLVALHQACQGLLAGEADLQIAGGVSVRVPEHSGYLYREGMINSPDGHCRPFDQNAAGTVAGNGVGCVVLRRLEDALAERDHIYAVILATAINNDGDDKVGYAAPSVSGQARVIRSALALAEIPAHTVGLVETHGSGTRMGDPIEVEALRSAYASAGWQARACALGAVKANIGHLDAAAGIAGFIKAVLALHHRQIPPHPNFKTANPLCELTADGPFFVNQEPLDWADPGHPRRAAVSSFGMGGTNAHVLLEQAPQPVASDADAGWQLVPLSAKTLKALDRRKETLRTDLLRLREAPLADIAYTLQTGRAHFQHGFFLVARCTSAASETLSMGFNQLSASALWDGVERQAAFLFPGQGAQFPGMGRALYEREPVFRDEIDACTRVIAERLGWSLTEVLLATDDGAEERLRQTCFTQPALFAVELALARLFMSWGIIPGALMGHSVGEYVAATLAGVMARDEAAVLVAERGRLIDQLPRGDMLFVPLGEQRIAPFMDADVDLAVQNTPSASVLSGGAAAIAAVQQRLAAEGIEARRLQTSHAFHSHLMEPILEAMEALVGRVDLRPPAIPMISNRTGTWLTANQATDPGYWAGHLRDRVRFFQGVETLAESVPRLFLELGPGSALASFCRETLGKTERYRMVSTLPRPSAGQDAHSTALMALGQVWQQGLAVDWGALHRGRARNRLPLSGYPFHGGDYWVATPNQTPDALAEARPVGQLRTRVWGQWPTPAPALGDLEQMLILHAGTLPLRHLRQALLGRVRTLISAVPAAAFRRQRNGDFRLRYGVEEDYLRLFEGLECEPRRPLDILAMYPRSSPGGDAQLAGFLCLIKALARHTGTTSAQIRLTLLLPASHDVLGTEAQHWETQAAAAMVAILGGLAPGITWRILDAGELSREPRLWQRGKMGRAWMTGSAPLLADLTGFEAGTTTAYRNGQRWRLQELPVSNLNPPTPSADAGYLITGELSPWAVELLRRWQRRWGGHFVYLLPPSGNRTSDATNSNRQIVEGLEAEGLSLKIARSEALMFVLPNLRRRIGNRPLSLWHLNARQADEHDELLMYLNSSDLAEITGTTRQLLSALQSVPVDKRVWISTLPAYYRHPPHALQILSETPLCASRQHGWHVVHLPEDLFAAPDTGSWAGIDEDRRMELLAEALDSTTTQGDLLLSALSPRAAAWSGRRMAPAAEAPEAAGAADDQTSTASYARPDLPVPYAAPVTDRQKAICVIWQELFQIDRVGIHDNFFDLGGDSVMALRLLSALEGHFRVQLPLAEVMNAPTIAEQANSVVDYAENALEGRRASPLVALHREGTQPPFFCVHPAGGLVHCYVEMARALGRDLPFYGFQHPGLDGKTGPYKTYSKMAELYITAMREVQPDGPYYIGGWSFGGTAAYEMARQLHVAGEEVGMLALFDSPGPSALYRLQGRPDFELAGMMAFLSQALARMFGGEIELDIEELTRIPREQQMSYLVERMVSVTGQDEMANAREALERVIDIFELTDRAEQIYEPEPYAGRVHLYRVQEVGDYEYTAYKDHPQIGRADFGWGQLCDDLVVRFVPGSHMNMIFPPNIEVLADKLGADLRAQWRSGETRHAASTATETNHEEIACAR
jgi:phthiocerol/phenolphthiocerol synthesis type-I polyketide synthase E